MKQTQTFFIKGWYWDNTAQFIQYYGEICVAKFIVKMKPGFRFEDYI